MLTDFNFALQCWIPALCLQNRCVPFSVSNTVLRFQKEMKTFAWISKEEGILVFLVKMTEEPLVEVKSIPTYTDANRLIKLQRI